MAGETYVLPVLAAQCLLIVAASLLGGKLPDWMRLTHERLQMMMSFVGGLMLGIGLFHMLPHAFAQLGTLDDVCLTMLAGLLLMFLLLRVFHFHEHEPVDLPHGHAAVESAACAHDHDHDHDHRPMAARHVHPPVGKSRNLSWAGVMFGLSLHTLIDGTALAASVQAEAAGTGRATLWLGMGTFLAIVLHKPLDAVSITSLMTAGGWPSRARLLVNVAFAVMCPLGAALFLAGVRQFSGQQALIVGHALALSAGVFVCIAMSDLLPEIEFHSHDQLKLTLLLVAGVVTACVLRLLEPGITGPAEGLLVMPGPTLFPK